MLSSIDLKFNYVNILRYLLINKMPYLTSIYSIPSINGILLFFSVKNVTFLDATQNFNFFYFFKFFMGRSGQLSKVFSRYSFGETFFSYNVELFLDKKSFYFFLFYLNNDIFFLLDEEYIFINKNYFVNKQDFLFASVKDLSIFSEIKTNIGLFDLKLPLNIKFFFLGGDSTSNLFLLNNLKFKHF